jgi:hypothetical protein
MRTDQLRTAAFLHRRLGPQFGGVFASNKLPKIANKNAYIVNLDPASKPGSHWVAIYFDKTKASVDYFDSYGLKPKSVHIIRFLKRNAMFKHYNEHVYQSPCSVVCGQYCLYFLYHRAASQPMSLMQRHFHSTTKEINDRRVVRFTKKHFNLNTKKPYIDVGCVQTAKALL